MSESSEHPVQQLWASHHPAGGEYPSELVPVDRPIPGRAFFPGGFGLWGAKKGVPLPPLPVGGVMILGHDFHSEEGYKKSLALGAEPESMPTWRNLWKLLDEIPIRMDECFFTNFYMGLRKGAGSTGIFPAAGDREFVDHCSQFLLRQLRLQRPSLVITLGLHLPPLLSPLSEELRDWEGAVTIKQLDQVGPLRAGVSFNGLPNFLTTVAAIIHPSLRHASLRHRRYRGEDGPRAEVELLKEARRLAQEVSSGDW